MPITKVYLFLILNLLVIKIASALDLNKDLRAYRSLKIAKVVNAKGDTKVNRVRLKNMSPLSSQVILSSGDIILSGKKSYLFLTLENGNHLHLGENTTLEVLANKKENRLYLNLIEGKMRARFYNKSSKSISYNVYVKTHNSVSKLQSADILLITNEKANRTLAINFKGRAQFTLLDPDDSQFEVSQDSLNKLVSKNSPTTLGPGDFSMASGEFDYPTTASKISVAQATVLEQNLEFKIKPRQKVVQPKSFGSPIPEHADPRRFTSSYTDLNTTYQKKQLGVYKPLNGYFRPTPGGYVDLNTAQYIMPPSNAHFDTSAKVFIPPTKYGTFDIQTGQYVAPFGFKLLANGEFQKVGETSQSGDQIPKLVSANDLFISTVKDNLSGVLHQSFLNEYEEEVFETQTIPKLEDTLKGKTPLNISITVQ